ncbi:hypothetical protein GWI33_013378 [Rhynchophorus ferrugineus]|uniref:Uncharacterized protein n=1 Tax=Rhynchophorus ferrugineus TaxID=354439 RepID=A0A834I758_RHYFE|nr:hypothetical protein GWI33_013378 [Rhynchophorus ferrugineus]
MSYCGRVLRLFATAGLFRDDSYLYRKRCQLELPETKSREWSPLLTKIGSSGSKEEKSLPNPRSPTRHGGLTSPVVGDERGGANHVSSKSNSLSVWTARRHSVYRSGSLDVDVPV